MKIAGRSTVVLVALLAGGAFAACHAGSAADPGPTEARGARLDKHRLDVVPEEPQGYAENPSSLIKPLRQDLTSLELERRHDGRYRLQMGADSTAVTLEAADFRPFIPRIPALARGDATLAHLALMQREFNRNETQFGPVPAGIDDFRIANNCLRCGLWEIMLAKKVDNSMALAYHGWFTFPVAEYERLFEEVNGTKYAEVRELLERYADVGGFPVALTKLRTVNAENELAGLSSNAAEDVARLPEQKRKAKLLLTAGIKTYGDFCAAEKQPIKTARFSEPGRYDASDPVSFDLAWLGAPKQMICRRVVGVAQPVPMVEIEIAFANGHRIVLGDQRLVDLAVAKAVPQKESEVVQLTFGIGTPEIYAAVADRAKEFAADPANYLLLLDQDGKHVDNHRAGVDRAFVWRDAEKLHVWLVGYERIALVAHLSASWPSGS